MEGERGVLDLSAGVWIDDHNSVILTYYTVFYA